MLATDAIDKQTLLREVSLFRDLKKRDLTRIMKRTKTETLQAGTTIIREGEVSSGLYIIIRGSVKVIKDRGSARERSLRILTSGEYFGEMALLDGGARSASVLTLEKTEVLHVEASAIMEAVERDPSLAMDMFRILSRRLRDLEESMYNVLGGILPICSGCKKIRDENETWQDLESYITHHSDAEFSHSFCPDCAHKLYPEVFDVPPAEQR